MLRVGVVQSDYSRPHHLQTTHQFILMLSCCLLRFINRRLQVLYAMRNHSAWSGLFWELPWLVQAIVYALLADLLDTCVAGDFFLLVGCAAFLWFRISASCLVASTINIAEIAWLYVLSFVASPVNKVKVSGFDIRLLEVIFDNFWLLLSLLLV